MPDNFKDIVLSRASPDRLKTDPTKGNSGVSSPSAPSKANGNGDAHGYRPSSASHLYPHPRISRREERLLFARNFLQHPRMLGSLIPSSRFLVERLLGKIDWQRARTIVEYGPGVGTITGPMLARMLPEGRLLVFEMNEDFVDYLTRSFPDPRLHVVHASAETVQGELDRLRLDGADYIVSGIPFTTMPRELREAIMQESRAALNPGGAVLVYQFTRAVLPCLRAHFSNIDQDFEFRNILPARLFYCTQEAA